MACHNLRLEPEASVAHAKPKPPHACRAGEGLPDASAHVRRAPLRSTTRAARHEL